FAHERRTATSNAYVRLIGACRPVAARMAFARGDVQREK
ncbi:hypothetical protein L915_21714, partial [Phytophthora nicotianae]